MSKLKCFKNKISKSLKKSKEDLEDSKTMYVTLIRYTSNHFKVYDTTIVKVFDSTTKLKEYTNKVINHIKSVHPSEWDKNNWRINNYYGDKYKNYYNIGIEPYVKIYYKYNNTEMVKLEIHNYICELNDSFNSILIEDAK